MSRAPHIPVLLDDVLAAIAPVQGAVVVDGTFGAGGYAFAARDAGADHVYGFDRDPDAIAAGRRHAGGQLTLIEERFSRMGEALADRGVGRVDAIMLDIGVSSMQLDQAARGFSFREDGPLDMRMAQDGPTAADLVNEADEGELADIIYHYGDERAARRVARALVGARPLARTHETAEIIRRAVGHRPGAKTDLATKTFQALRIAVNDEMGELEAALEAAERLLAPGGRLAIVSFHSLEDRIVKQFLRTRSGGAPGGSRHQPELNASGPAPTFARPARPVRAGDAELRRNPRSRSATLRAATRTDAAAWAGTERADAAHRSTRGWTAKRPGRAA
ncbi:16S rRNA (cytosine(1402)-N(4))-methyltransferase RsmH [Pacificimonas sp. WHA3]|uniref:Ribosomal RNA small subunit methyltransferase H n=1 Tax=Pacificimonas pallii TaxID=2827236 RepID=A0ABS6SFL9_9SPHN|nr:16S rRNA (cytosine(1402)-N(4))-methyltransferase RsmH [Pacificimonas pallii]MBV7257218.1 16S rRNA (cytosine(1402)-N(4))-methyltransferase RsmH [Pacificimonas pallii]